MHSNLVWSFLSFNGEVFYPKFQVFPFLSCKNPGKKDSLVPHLVTGEGFFFSGYWIIQGCKHDRACIMKKKEHPAAMKEMWVILGSSSFAFFRHSCFFPPFFAGGFSRPTHPHSLSPAQSMSTRRSDSISFSLCVQTAGNKEREGETLFPREWFLHFSLSLSLSSGHRKGLILTNGRGTSP